MKESTKTYGKYILTGAVGVGLGFGAFTATDTPTKQTDTYKNLQDDLDTAQSNADNFESQVAELETTVTDKEEKVSNLEAQVEQFNATVEELRAENADLEDAVATAQDRVGLVDYLPVFSDGDVEFTDLGVEVDADSDSEEGEYDRISTNYTDEDGGDYDVEITEYEESEDADDAVEYFREENSPVEFTADGDTHTVEFTGFTGSLNNIDLHYDDSDAVEDVDHENYIESVTVDGEDITDKVDSVSLHSGDTQLRVSFDESHYVNDGEKVSVTFSNAGDGELEKVQADDDRYDEDYDQSSDSREDIYRDGNTVVEVTGDRNGDAFEAQYEDLASQYE